MSAVRTVTLNPAIDRRVEIEDFGVDRVNRVRASSMDAGGKGINVSKVLAALGARTVAHGFVAGRAGDFIEAYLDAKGIAHRFTRIAGETRTNLKIVDPVAGTHTDINEAGPPASPADLARLEEGLFAGLGPEDILVLSGSACPGCDDGVYARWISRAKAVGARTVLDADGTLLKAGVAAGPDLVKPNLAELERLSGRALGDEAAMLGAMRDLLRGGTGAVALSLGEAGALFLDRDGPLRVRGVPVRALTTVGAGDSMLAAAVAGMAKGEPMAAWAGRAVAAGTAACAMGGSGAVDADAVSRYEPLAAAERI